MQNNYTHVTILLDRSGSMANVKEATVSGFNEFLNSQKEIDGKCTLTLAQFDNHYEVIHDFKDVKDIEPLTLEQYRPRSNTPLVGALGKTIDELGKRLKDIPESLRPDKVVIVTITDGQENWTSNMDWSRHYNRDLVRGKVRHQEQTYSWQFLYLGANQDAVLTGSELGFQTVKCATYHSTARGSAANFSMLAGKLGSFRLSDNAADLDYSTSDRKTLSNAN